MANKILFVFEGQKTEKLITDNLKANFFNASDTIIQTAYCTTIYNLYKEIAEDENLDVFTLLKEKSSNTKELSLYRRDDFAEIYLFFDYDGHTTSAADQKLKKMLNLFNEETAAGKLYISYPMVEALKHYSSAIDFRNLKVDAKKNIKYKQKVNLECDPELINMPKYTYDIWIKLIEVHLKKMNYILRADYSLPIQEASQEEIFQKQIEKFINIDKTVSVLSAFPVFILDYYGCKHIAGLFTE